MKHKEYRMGHVFYPTGLNLDYINNEYQPSIPDGSMIMLIGKSDVDKETLAVQIANNIVKDLRLSAIFHDSISTDKSYLLDKSVLNYCHRNLLDGEITFDKLYERIKSIYEARKELKDHIIYDTGLVFDTGKEKEKIYKYEPTVYILHTKCLKIEYDLDSSETQDAILKIISKMCREVNIILILIMPVEVQELTDWRDFYPSIASYLNYNETADLGIEIAFLSNYILRIDKNGNSYTVKIFKSMFESMLEYSLAMKNGKYIDANKNE